MDFDKIIRNAFMHENFKNLNAYFEREFKKAQRDNFYEKDDFFNPILAKLERIEKLNNDDFEKHKLNLKIVIKKAQENDFEHRETYYSNCLDRLGVLYESYKQEQNDLRVKDFTKQLENLSLENFKRNSVFDDYSNSQISKIKNAVNNVNGRKVEQQLELTGSKTSKVIVEAFRNMAKDGWEYAFSTEQDYNLFTDLLTNFFEYKPYKLPETPIQLKRMCKTKVAKALGEIHEELSNENKLSTDNNYFQLIRVLSHFKEETKDDLYKALTR